MKPRCYKDPDIYDQDDEECIQCTWYGSCGALVKSKTARRDRNTRSVHRSSSTIRPPAVIPKDSDYEYDDPEDADTFTSVLLHNSTLNALQGVTQTLNDAVAHIPRKSYQNLFTKMKKRKKK